MRYDDALTVDAVKNWAQEHFELPINVYNFSNSFLITSKNEVILIRKLCGTVEVRNN